MATNGPWKAIPSVAARRPSSVEVGRPTVGPVTKAMAVPKGPLTATTAAGRDALDREEGMLPAHTLMSG